MRDLRHAKRVVQACRERAFTFSTFARIFRPKHYPRMFKVHLTYVAKKKKKRLLKLQPYWFNEFAVVVESIGGRLKPNNQ